MIIRLKKRLMFETVYKLTQIEKSVAEFTSKKEHQ